MVDLPSYVRSAKDAVDIASVTHQCAWDALQTGTLSYENIVVWLVARDNFYKAQKAFEIAIYEYRNLSLFPHKPAN